MYGRVQNPILFDDINDIDEDYLPASGNEDFLDSIKSVCLECGSTDHTRCGCILESYTRELLDMF